MISSKIHAVLDYIMGILLIAIPWLLGFEDHGPATALPVILGISTLIYSLLTDYEYAIAPAFSFRGHLLLDMMSAVLLLISPWLFGFSKQVFLPHVILGAFEIMAVILTTKQPPDTKFVIRSS
ncbi:SPW repeat domain-containing protein [Chryseobacterium flavum]|uniref:SPW repeat domain-containing protein n=1 Tax=Chryseobacterium flavum TaxID=415851 RepID=UPI0028B2305C|nr:hypothetical protein [Chryseobacterium flavum]